jgi:hypothetical protein
MPRENDEGKEKTINLLEKILVFQLFVLGVQQEKIAKIVRRSKSWVNELLKGIPKGGKYDGDKKEAKKGKRRSHS